jgi:hypothetical protein
MSTQRRTKEQPLVVSNRGTHVVLTDATGGYEPNRMLHFARQIIKRLQYEPKIVRPPR